MTTRLVMFDLGCGLGGASAAMRDRGWSVYRIDCERDVKADHYCDIRNLMALPGAVDLIWVSTNCSQFTLNSLPYSSCVTKRMPIDLTVENAAKDLIERARPRFWLVENVPASRKWLSLIFGRVLCNIGSSCLWGNVPLLLKDVRYDKRALNWELPHGRERHLMKSLIPYEISEAVAATIERLSEPSSRSQNNGDTAPAPGGTGRGAYVRTLFEPQAG